MILNNKNKNCKNHYNCKYINLGNNNKKKIIYLKEF